MILTLASLTGDAAVGLMGDLRATGMALGTTPCMAPTGAGAFTGLATGATWGKMSVPLMVFTHQKGHLPMAKKKAFLFQ